MSRYEQFHQFRTRLNERILADQPGRPGGTLNTKRFFTLDTSTYKPGALDEKTKELLGLVASMVLRCDDCIAYHIDTACKQGATDQELWETFDIALIVGGSIVIPHLRRAVEFLDECRARGITPGANAPANTAAHSRPPHNHA
jgi:AhpD family alkylhydroperoxidase